MVVTLVRLSAWPEVPPWVPPIFRRRSDGELAVLLADKAPIGKDMRNAPAGCEVIFTSSFRVRDNRAYGTPVDATGRAHIDREVSLDLAEWVYNTEVFTICQDTKKTNVLLQINILVT